MNEKIECKFCGKLIPSDSLLCPYCRNDLSKESINNFSVMQSFAISKKDFLGALLWCIFLGYFGAHRFYAGKTGTGILWLCTFGIFWVGWIVDLVMIATGHFIDSDGLPIKSDRWKRKHNVDEFYHGKDKGHHIYRSI